MQARCSNQHDCIVPVQSSIFGDPCPGTFKYIEVHYACRKEPVLKKTTTTRPLWFPPASPRPGNWPSIDKHLSGLHNESSLANSTTKPLLTTLDPEDYEDESIDDDHDSDEIPGLDDGFKRVIKVKVPKVPHNFKEIQTEHDKYKSHLPINLPGPLSEDDEDHHEDVVVVEEEAPTTKRPSVSLQVLANFTQYCPPARSRNLFWNWTLAGDTAVVQCPSGATGFAKWKCDSPEDKAKKAAFESNTAWSPKGPSLAECRSLWLGELDSKLRGGKISVANVSHILADKTSPHLQSETVLFGGDLGKTLRFCNSAQNY